MKFMKLPTIAVSAVLGFMACSDDSGTGATEPGNEALNPIEYPYGNEVPGTQIPGNTTPGN